MGNPKQTDLEDEAAALVSQEDVESARHLLTKHSNDSSAAAVSSYHALFETFVARYHDGYKMEVGSSAGSGARMKISACCFARMGKRMRIVLRQVLGKGHKEA